MGTAACVVALAGLVFAAAAPAKFRGAPNSGLQRALDEIVDAPGGPPGVSVLLDRGPHREYLWAGVADTRSNRPPTPFDHFRIASVAKAFNSYIGVKLVGNGALGLDQTLKESIPGVLPAAEGVKLRELLQHTSGIAEYITTPAFGQRLTADPAAYISPFELTEYVRNAPLGFAPGSRYHYSDTDNIAAGLMEEVASGLNYEQLLQRRVFGPLKMPSSSLPRTIAMPRPFMHGYDVEPGSKPEDVSELINPAGAWASGGIVSTPLDLARFARRYVPTVLAATRELDGPFRPGSSSPPGPGKNLAGLGIFRYRTGCGTVYGHTGSFPGYRILLAASADGKRSVVFVATSQIVPGQGSPKVAKAITQAQGRAICRALS
ncbi:MAG TPA: serine hydrolase domain-containing protein [Solirubrobacterales bacterium]|nr:serine hydrolase domain-containing protein [Solirubrobacterales bacterium]